MNQRFSWARHHPNGYELSSRVDRRFSAFYARLPDGRSIEDWYQCNVKGYPITSFGKGKPPLNNITREVQWDAYLSLWKLWCLLNQGDLIDLLEGLPEGPVIFTDMFASTDINQARAIATVLNEWLPS